MPVRKLKYRKKPIIVQFVIFLLISIVMTFFLCPPCIDEFWTNPKIFIFAVSYNMSFWVFLGAGNGFLTDIIDTKVSWTEQTTLRFILAIVSTLVYSFIVIYLITFLLPRAFGFSTSEESTNRTILYAFLITIGVSLFLNGRGFLLAWKRTAVAAEKLKAEKLLIQYNALQAQVNPHFLFNSFNTLSSLIEIDAKKAVRYVDQLSDIMRYVLDARKKDVVSLGEEMAFSSRFIELSQLRFGEAVVFKDGIPQDLYDNYMVVPMAIQLLLENALKHNTATRQSPLHVELYLQEEFAVVKNNLQVKSVPKEKGGFGLQNLKERYSYLSKKEVEIIQDSKEFTVKTPLLTT